MGIIYDNPLNGRDTIGLVPKKPKQTIKKPRKPQGEKEHKEQVAFFVWARRPETLRKYPLFNKLLFSVPNGGHRSITTAKKIKAEGSEAGVSDILFLVPSRGFHYLCIEMKADKGRQSDAQKEFEAEADKVGGLYQLAYSAEEAQKIAEWYYSGIKL